MKRTHKKASLVLALFLVPLFVLSACNDSSGSASNTSGTTDKTPAAETKTEYAIGDTWTVDGQWELTINSVKSTDARNEYDDHNPAAVYIIDYTYKNLGYKDPSNIMNGLYMSLDMETIVDSAGTMGYMYADTDNIVNGPQEVPVGANCTAQVAIGVDHAGPFTLTVNEYDSNNDAQDATFKLAV